MKKLSWILIITLLASCLSACGKKETVIYQGDTASTSDATDDPIRNLDYTVPGDKGTLTVQAQVDTSLAEKSAPVASLSRADFTDEDIQAYADLIFDEGSYSLFMPYDFRSIEDLTSACGAWEDTFKSYENFSTIPEYMIAEYYDATNVLATKKQDADAAKRVVETNGEMKWYINPYSERDDIGQFIPNQLSTEPFPKSTIIWHFLNPTYSVVWYYTNSTVLMLSIFLPVTPIRRIQFLPLTLSKMGETAVPSPSQKRSRLLKNICRH